MKNKKTGKVRRVTRRKKFMSADERKLLHDLATPLTVVQGMIESALNILRANPEQNAQAITKLEKSGKACARMTTLIQERRKILVASEKEDQPKVSASKSPAA